MKRILTSAFVILLSIGAAQAQTTSTEKTKGQHKEHRKEGFASLNLTPDQQARLKAIREEHKKKAAELKGQQLTAAEAQTRRQELHKQYQSQFESILTQDQKSKLAQAKAEGRTARREDKKSFQKKGKGRQDGAVKQRGGRDFQKGTKELNLTAEQQTQVTRIRSEFKSNAAALRNDQSLTQEQRKTKMKALVQQQQEQVKSVLTKEQVQKMESFRKERAARNTK